MTPDEKRRGPRRQRRLAFAAPSTDPQDAAPAPSRAGRDDDAAPGPWQRPRPLDAPGFYRRVRGQRRAALPRG